MISSGLALIRLVLLLCALIMVVAAPSPSTSKYPYKVAKRADIVARSTRTRVHYRRASPLPGQSIYAVFGDRGFGGVSTSTNAETRQTTFGACAALCGTTSGCDYLRWNQDGGNQCSLRRGTPSNTSFDIIYRSAFRGLTCAQAKTQYRDLASVTCVEENY